MAKKSNGMRVSPNFHSKIVAISEDIYKRTNAKLSTVEITEIIAEKIPAIEFEKTEIPEFDIKFNVIQKRKQRFSIFDF